MLLSRYVIIKRHTEYKYHHILYTICSLLISSSCSKLFRGEATLIAMYTINCDPSFVMGNISSYEYLYETKPNYNPLRVWLYLFYLFFQPHKCIKLELHAQLCFFIDYEIKHKG